MGTGPQPMRNGWSTGWPALTGVESVKYRKEFLEIIDERARIVHNISLGLGVLVGLSAIVLVSNTIRLAISAKRQIIRTMELVGATRMFIRMPFLLEGIMQGLLGGVLAPGSSISSCLCCPDHLPRPPRPPAHRDRRTTRRW